MDQKTFKTLLIGSLIIGIGVSTMFGKTLISIYKNKNNLVKNYLKQEIVDEESVVTKVVEDATPSVVTVSIEKEKRSIDLFGFSIENGGETTEQDIGSGFIISEDGLIVTNKHVVNNIGAKYKVIIGKDEMVDVINIYRDPTNDLAILKINKNGLNPVKMGDSDKIKVGGTVIAIGTALGEFRSTVTKGVVSGVGRGIVAGSWVTGSERLENVIQTDAAINPGNSGGPLFNSAGEVIGVNVAVSQEGQNIGFALPINLVKKSIENFKTTGEFERPYLGVGYKMISKQSALLNEVPAGAYVSQLSEDSPAKKAGIQIGDIIIEIDGKKLVDEKEETVANLINTKKIGDTIKIKLWRGEKDMTLDVKLEKRPN